MQMASTKQQMTIRKLDPNVELMFPTALLMMAFINCITLTLDLNLGRLDEFI